MTGPPTYTARLAVAAAAMALAGGGLAAWARLSAAHTLDDGRRQTSEVAEQLGARLQATAATARRRAEQLAALPPVRIAVENERAAALRLLRAEGLALSPAPGETIEIVQLPRGGRPTSLLRAPARARPLSPRRADELRVDGDRDALVLLVAAHVEPLYGRETPGGTVALATRVPLSPLTASLGSGGLAAQLVGLDAPLPLSSLPPPPNARLVTASVPLPGARPLAVRVSLPAANGVVLWLGRALLVAAFALALWTLVEHRRRRDDAEEAETGRQAVGTPGLQTLDEPGLRILDDPGLRLLDESMRLLDEPGLQTQEALTVPNMRSLGPNIPQLLEDVPTDKQTARLTESSGHLVLAWSQPMPTPISQLRPMPTAPLQLYVEPRAELLTGRYRLLQPLGRGDTADVYLAQCFLPGMPSTVALKLLAAGTPSSIGERFLQDAHRQLRVTHPNVVQIYEVGGEQLGYVAMEYVEGCTLAKLMKDLSMRGELLPLPQAVAIVAAIAHALEAAQQARDERGARRPLVHGAIKPSNVLIGRHGAIKLSDFGAPSASERYAPEQYAGKPADRRSDVYTLGVILHELVANRHPTAPSRATPTSWPPLPAPSLLRPELPRALDAVVARATRFGPRGRYADAAELLDELQRATAHASANERPSGVLGDWVERARRSS